MNRILGLIILSIITGCVNLLPPAAPAPKNISLDPLVSVPAGKAVPWSLIIEKPLSPTLYDSRRLFVQVKNEAGLLCIEPLAGLEWEERFPVILQQHLVRAFQKTGQILGVGTGEEDFQSHYTLQLSLHRLYVVLDFHPHLKIELSVKLINHKGRQVMGQRLIEKSIKIPEKTSKHFLEAYNRAFGEILSDIVTWTLSQPDAHIISQNLK